MKQRSLLLTIFAAAITGCGGGLSSIDRTGEVSGNIIDLNGNLVQNVEVSIDDKTSFSNTGGAYVVRGLREGVWQLRAESEPVDGISFSGQTAVQVFEGERSKSVNVTLVRQDQQATLFGVVRDRFGNILQGAHVFAFIEKDGVTLSSVMDVSNSVGEYELKSLAAGYTYVINGSGRGYGSDRDTVVLNAGESRRFDISLGDAFDPLLDPPGNLSAITWTTPTVATRGASNHQDAFEVLKRRFDRKRAARSTSRLTSDGGNIEVDLTWDRPTSNLNYLLGYGVYRALSVGGNSVPIDFLRDPETYFFADLADELQENSNYYYEMTSLNVNYPDTGNSESNFSNRVLARTLDDLFLGNLTQGPLTFRWDGGSGATEYYVYLFDELPTFGSVEVYVNAAPIVGTSHVYPGPALQSGRRYYYMVLGLANGGESRTISELGDFVAN